MNIILALDWTPNTNHTGFYVAQARGWYRQAGLDVTFLSPEIDQYAITSPERVARSQATFGITPSEMLIDYHLSPERVPLIAVAAILQRNVSAIVATQRSGVTRPAGLDGRVYAAYDMPVERAIIRQLIRNDGGRGEFREVHPPTLDVWRALITGQADACWAFMPWEGMEIERSGVPLNVFDLDAYGIPYGYAPVLLAHPDTLAHSPDAVRAFVQASAKGFEFAAQNADEAARLLIDTAQHPTLADADFVRQSQRRLADALLSAQGRWGVMETQRWSRWVAWLCERRMLKDAAGRDVPLALLNAALDAGALFTNAFL